MIELLMMFDERLARLRAHRNNISRYNRLLITKLTDVERDFILRRLEDEEQVIATLSGSRIAAPPG